MVKRQTKRIVRDYTTRIVDQELDELLPGIAAVALEGPKAVGKTATALRRSRSVVRLDLPVQQELARADLAGLLQRDRPLLLDEWQHVPEVWDAVRHAVDDGAAPGSFLLTGSAAPRHGPRHTGAGRIVKVRMRPLSLAERDLGTPTVSVADLLRGNRPALAGRTEVSLAAYAKEIVQTGFPGMRSLAGRVLRSQVDGYLAQVIERDVVDLGMSEWKTSVLRSWLAVYAAATATTTSLEKLRASASLASVGERDSISKPTALLYHDILQKLWIADPLSGWSPTRNNLARMTQAPRLHLADPGLSARLLGVDADALLSGNVSPLTTPDVAGNRRFGTLLGQLFESLVSMSVRIYAQAAEARAYHLRQHGGAHEVDLILERADHRVVAIEVKLSETVGDDDVVHLRWLREKLGEDLLDAIVVSTGPQAYRRPDGIGVVPAALLGP
jgi:predicted AAA+ superfamily ATPase